MSDPFPVAPWCQREEGGRLGVTEKHGVERNID